MKKQALSGVVLVLGGCLWSVISGFGGADRDHAAEARIKVEVAKSAPDFILNAEIKAKLELETGTAEMPDITGAEDEWIAVPTDALTNLSEDGKQATVYFTEDPGTDGADQKFTAAEVKLGETKAGYVEVISGLFPGDTVIVKNASRIGENRASEVAEIQEKTSEEKTPDVKLAKLSPKAAEPKTVQVDRAKASASTNESSELVFAKDPAACDFRCPLEDRASRRLCPEDVAPACDRASAYQDSAQCDRDFDRRKHNRNRSGRHW